ncbi:MAG: transposase [Oscillospiraceae bacterium]|nr:transposase [Oscillospiraceae bacterium]
MDLLQIWLNFSDPATEDAIYHSYAMRKFTGIDFMMENVPNRPFPVCLSIPPFPHGDAEKFPGCA